MEHFEQPPPSHDVGQVFLAPGSSSLFGLALFACWLVVRDDTVFQRTRFGREWYFCQVHKPAGFN